MKLAFRGLIVVAAVMAGSFALVITVRAQGGGQQAPEQKPPMAEEVFKNIQVLRGIPVDEFMDTMGFLSAATGLNCQDCHVGESGGDWSKYADDTRRKVTARSMMNMVNNLNRANFSGRRVVSCYTCHRGSYVPEVVPDLAVQYSDALPRDPFEIRASAAGAPSIDAVLDKYIQAIGGGQRLATLQSLTVKGTYSGWDTSHLQAPLEVFVKAPDQRTTIVHAFDGDITTVYDGQAGWTAAPETMKPVPVLAMTGGNLDAAKIEAELFFPARIKDMLTEWRVGLTTTIDDREVQLVQGKLRTGSLPVTLYFDVESNLLVRVVHYTSSPVGVNPRQVDFADYRDVAGIKMPFRWTLTWTDGKSTVEVTEFQPNVTIEASRFAKPPASKAVTRRNP